MVTSPLVILDRFFQIFAIRRETKLLEWSGSKVWGNLRKVHQLSFSKNANESSTDAPARTYSVLCNDLVNFEKFNCVIRLVLLRLEVDLIKP